MEFLKKNKTGILILVLWLIITVYTGLNHEMWRDEAQAWCIVRDNTLLEIFKITSLEGHPLLWYILILPFAKLGISPVFMNILSFAAVLAAVIFLVFKSPFSLVIKTAAVLGAGMSYYLPVIARSYALIPVLLFITADLYSKRHEHPYKYALVLILLSNTHPFMLALSGMLFLTFVFETFKQSENRRSFSDFAPALLLFFNFAFLVLTLTGTVTKSYAVVNYIKTAKPFIETLKSFPLLFFEFDFLPDFLKILIFYASIAAIAFVFFKYSKKIFILFFFGAGYIFFLYSKIWFHGIAGQKSYIFLLIILFCAWIFSVENKNKTLNAALAVLFLINSINTFYAAPKDIKYSFSEARSTAEFIKNSLKDEKIFCTIGAGFTFTPIAAYLPDKKFYSYNDKMYISYHSFDAHPERHAVKEPECRYYIVQEYFFMNDDFKVIFSSGDNILSSKEYREVFKIYTKK